MKTIDHYYSYRTYSGCLEGYPEPESVYSSIKKEVKKLWGDRTIHIVEPELKIIPKSHHFGPYSVLPSWTHIAWVNGPAKDRENDGSHLVVVWFTQEPLFNAQESIDKIDWDKYAEDFQY